MMRSRCKLYIGSSSFVDYFFSPISTVTFGLKVNFIQCLASLDACLVRCGDFSGLVAFVAKLLVLCGKLCVIVMIKF